MKIPRVTTIPPGYLPNAALPLLPDSNVRLVHASALYPMSGDTLRCHYNARASWEREGSRTSKWLTAWLDIKDAERTSSKVGDARNVHFVKDLLDHGAAQCPMDTDIIVLTNTDNSFVSGITERLIWHASRTPVWGHRMDFPKLTRMLTREEALMGIWYPGFDLFAMTRAWWNEHRDEMPDALVGYIGWDSALYVLMAKYGGEDFGVGVVHETHVPNWSKLRNSPGQKWNSKVIRPFLLAHGWSKSDVERYA